MERVKHFCVEPLVPLRVGQRILSEFVEAKLLVVHYCKIILVLRLPQESLFNQSIKGQRVI